MGKLFKKGGSIGLSIGRTYGSMGWASLFMPALLGIIADKYLVLKSFRFCPYYSGYCNLFCNASHKFNGDVLGYFLQPVVLY
jgi:hypothetical protein